MVLINRLKNGAGKDCDFGLYLPKGVDILAKSPEFMLSDDEIPEKIKQGNLKLLYRPNICTIRRNEADGKIVLTDIATHQVGLPTDLASFMPEKACPEIVFHGYMLCKDKNLGKLTAEEQAEVQKIINHFDRLTRVDMKKSARHELKHIENSMAFNEAHRPNTALSHEYFIRKCFVDEISATAKEEIEDKAQTREEGLAYLKKTFSSWLNNPQRVSYYGEHGDFEHQYGVYESKTQGRDTSKSEEMFVNICKKFLTFKINGIETDLSAAVNPNFELPNSKTAQTQSVCLKSSLAQSR